MRTTILSFCRGKKEEVRKYSVSGMINFKMSSAPDETNFGELKKLIIEIDKLFPWKDELSKSEEKARRGRESASIFYISKGKEFINNWHNPEKNICFHIFTEGGSLRKAQIYAYEKYLAKLAEELAKRKPTGVAAVSCVVKIVTTAEFTV